MAASGEYIGTSFYRAWDYCYLRIFQLEPGRLCGASGPRGQDQAAPGQGEERHCGPHQLHALQVRQAMRELLVIHFYLFRIRYRMFSDSDEGGDRSWSELRHDLLAVEERTSGWLPDIQLATLMRTNMQVRSFFCRASHSEE